MIRGILFDKDGTLIEFEKMWHAIVTLVFQKIEAEGRLSKKLITRFKAISGYTEEGFEPESIIQSLPTSHIVALWAEAAAGEGMDRMACEGYLHRLFEAAAVDERVAVECLPGVAETLAYLRSKNYYLGVATADTEKSMHHSLRKAELDNFFQFFGSDNGYHEGKPAPHMAKDFCRHVGITSEELLIVGDSVSDQRFAENAKANFVGIISDYGAFSDTSDSKVPLVGRFCELIEVMAL